MSVTIANLESVVAERPAISLDELNNVAALLTRIDRKYVLDSETATAFLAKLPQGTLALEIDGLRQFGYTSTYMDTDELDSFRATAHKRARRGKVRTCRATAGTACSPTVGSRWWPPESDADCGRVLPRCREGP